MSGRMSGEVSGQMSGEVSVQMSDQMSGQMSDQIGGQMSFKRVVKRVVKPEGTWTQAGAGQSWPRCRCPALSLSPFPSILVSS